MKQNHEEICTLRTNTTIDDTRYFYFGENLRNLPALRQISFQVDRRLLRVEPICHDCPLPKVMLQKINCLPIRFSSQRVSKL